ncbi:GNAT family N-acetyltransferase [Rhodanobacter spathiphylli]|jgi:RimJ/RimL family protein N-acetyltransferase|uniref:N-acetyltransferase domain-containing protein n=1 Tax=Rhodanobacter spathiphylli B39 TaxID=1163407 RepID=I4VNF2_9GAMM|nr:GNAT family N-acetyltransferase [Rhodanobacter spathiphylli]EIL88743.1 hypothetical protein UU7_17062 [Rhodanobacter spathiphylli B39]
MMKIVTLDSLDAQSRVFLADMLDDPVLRASLFGGSGHISAWHAERIWSHAVDDETRWLVRCVESQRIVGGIGVVREEVRLFVRSDLQGQGYGRASLAALLQLRQTLGVWPNLSAWTVRENRAARLAFEAAHWRELGLRRQGGGLPTLVHYCSSLV